MPGILLISYLRGYPKIEKKLLFQWFRQLLHLLEQYQKCKKGRCYRYLNPYSILVSKDERLLLLNLESPENEEALKGMQLRTVSSRFVKPVLERRENSALETDLFCFGTTIQFILSYVDISPSLTWKEERMLEKMIERCTKESGRMFTSFSQVQKVLPRTKAPAKIKKTGMWIGIAVVLCICVGVVSVIRNSEWEKDQQIEILQEEKEKLAEENQRKERQIQEEKEANIVEEIRSNFLLNTPEGNRKVIEQGESLELEILRDLTIVYERENLLPEAIEAYGRLCEIEEEPEEKERAGLKKMEMEAAQGNYGQAIETGEKLLEELGESGEIQKQLEHCEEQEQQEEKEIKKAPK